MIDNTFVQADGPLYTDREEALNASGAICVHVKKGGIYRRMGLAKYAGDKCADELDGEQMGVYEHLWPYPHTFFVRPDSEFEEVVKSEARDTEHARFERVCKISI